MLQEKENPDSQLLSKREKALLRSRIYTSINSYQRRKRKARYGITVFAAVAIVFISASIYSNKRIQSSTIENYAQGQTLKSNGKTVQLILNDTESIAITAEDANISYSKNGENIHVGDSQNVSQKSTATNNPIYNTLVVPFGKRSEVTLSDGSRVWLNSGSKLIFPAKFASEKREVYLEGEAIFEVSHNKDKPFYVKSKNHEIKVLGTVFNVSNYGDDDFVYTVLKSGSVQVNYITDKLFNPERNIKIIPGKMLTFDKQQRSVKEKSVDVDQYFSWRDGVFIFKNDPLKNIMKKISRYYNVEITITDNTMANETFSGYLDVKDSIESVLETIRETESSGFEYTINNNKISIN